MVTQTVSILGCGWLGLPLGRHLVNEGYRVKGATTTPEKRATIRRAGIEPYRIELTPELTGAHAADFFDAGLLVFNVPPPRDRDDLHAYHLRQVDAVCAAAAAGSVEWILFASSTGVYPKSGGVVTEEDAPHDPEPTAAPLRPTGAVLLEAERRLLGAPAFDATVVRFAGLYGGDREPGRFLAGRTNVAGGDAPVNLIHRDDCIGIVTAIIEQDARGEAFNACTDHHPTRRALYTAAARKLNLTPPTFEAGGASKIVSNARVKRTLGYTFQHPDPLA